MLASSMSNMRYILTKNKKNHHHNLKLVGLEIVLYEENNGPETDIRIVIYLYHSFHIRQFPNYSFRKKL